MKRHLIKYILTAAFRDRLLLSFFVTLIVGVALSSFFASTAVTEKNLFFVVFVASMLRLAGVFTIVTFIIFYIRKTFETREVEFMLTRPIGRVGYLLSHCAAFAIICVTFAFVSVLVMSLLMGEILAAGLWFWGLSLTAEFIIMAHIASFFSFTLSSAVTASLTSFSFYALSRMIGGILGIIQAEPAEGAMVILEKIMLLVSMVIPRLDLLSQSGWLVYGMPDLMGLGFIFMQLFVFVGLVFFATLVDLNRREF